MPELPEVETMARDLERKVKGLVIANAKIFDARVIFGLTPQAFLKQVKKKTMAAFMRRGKAVVVSLRPKGYLIIQPKMSGHLIYGAPSKLEITSATKAVFELSNKAVLHYNDHRMFGWLYYVNDLSTVNYLKRLGPEPLDKTFTADLLKEALLKRGSPVKVVLMNQEVIAGIGNIYASEILYDAGISPRRKASSLKTPEIKRLHTSIGRILLKAVELRGSSLRDYRDTSGEKGTFMGMIKVYRRQGQKCFRCGGTVEQIIQAQRSTFFCSLCQK